MNVIFQNILDITILFILLFIVAFFFAKRNISMTNLLTIKSGIFTIAFFSQFISQYFFHKSRDFKSVVRKCIFVGAFAVIGYSTYLDLNLMEVTRPFVDAIDQPILRSIFISSIIASFVLCANVLEQL